MGGGAGRGRSKLEVEFEKQLRDSGYNLGMEIEHRFHPTRRWRFDFCFPLQRVAVEIHGGIYVRGAHARPQGMVNDMTKAGEAAVLGWTVVAGSGSCVKNGRLLDVVQRLLDARGYRRFDSHPRNPKSTGRPDAEAKD